MIFWGTKSVYLQIVGKSFSCLCILCVYVLS